MQQYRYEVTLFCFQHSEQNKWGTYGATVVLPNVVACNVDEAAREARMQCPGTWRATQVREVCHV